MSSNTVHRMLWKESMGAEYSVTISREIISVHLDTSCSVRLLLNKEYGAGNHGRVNEVH